MPRGGPRRRRASLLLAGAAALALAARSGAQLTPARPSVDVSARATNVYLQCTSPATSTGLTSPVFDAYMKALRSAFTRQSPLFFTGQCKRQRVSGGLAECQYSFDAARSSGALAPFTALDGLPNMAFQGCTVALDGGQGFTSPSCFQSTSEDPPLVTSSTPQTDLGPTQFAADLQDNNAAVGGTRVGPIQVVLECGYYTPRQLQPQPITLATLAASGWGPQGLPKRALPLKRDILKHLQNCLTLGSRVPGPPATALQPATTADVQAQLAPPQALSSPQAGNNVFLQALPQLVTGQPDSSSGGGGSGSLLGGLSG